jgi:hypothetical protein
MRANIFSILVILAATMRVTCEEAVAKAGGNEKPDCCPQKVAEKKDLMPLIEAFGRDACCKEKLQIHGDKVIILTGDVPESSRGTFESISKIFNNVVIAVNFKQPKKPAPPFATFKKYVDFGKNPNPLPACPPKKDPCKEEPKCCDGPNGTKIPCPKADAQNTTIVESADVPNKAGVYWLEAHEECVADGDDPIYVLSGYMPDDGPVVSAQALAKSLGIALIDNVDIDPPMVEVNVRFLSVRVAKGENVGFNILGTNGSGISVVNMAEFTGAKDFLPHLSPGTVGLKWSSKTGNAVVLNVNHINTVGQVVASPFLSTRSGSEASFTQGGEVGVRVASLASAKVDYRPTGMTLKVTPVVQASGDIKCKVMFDVSAPTSLNSDIVQFSDTNTSNVALIHEGESLILSGFSQDLRDKFKNGVPFLRSIPALGFLFSDKGNNRDSQDLVIIITPHRVVNMNPRPCVCRTQNSRETIARILEEPNPWCRNPEGNKIERMNGPRDFLVNAELIEGEALKESGEASPPKAETKSTPRRTAESRNFQRTREPEKAPSAKEFREDKRQ